MFDCIRFRGYKSFPQDTDTYIPKIGYLNLFIGKNNSGKSSALDIVSAVYSAKDRSALQNSLMTIHFGYTIDDDTFNQVFNRLKSSRPRLFCEAKSYIGQYLWIEPTLRSGFGMSNSFFSFNYDKRLNESIQNNYVDWSDYFNLLPKPDHQFLRISAERNILPESTSINDLQPDGTGATTLIRKIINHKQYDERLIEEKLLQALNRIMGSDAHFESIRVQEIDDLKNEHESRWEVFLQETGSQRFPLSQSGSGLKTIILVLLNLLVIPEIDKRKPYAYGFEELENNLHPALQRRLYEYLYEYATEKEVPIFLTTHSHVAINMFYEKEHASIYHVTKVGCTSSIKQIDNYIDKAEILDDLDVKASDLLQANGVIWVEGPSDRIYVKRWLELFGGSDISEGSDYQFAYYGGRLLAHYSADEDCDGLINILLINRNSAIIIDSDKRYKSDKINDTKKRIQKEFDAKNLFSWITKGKEIENYLIVDDINRAFGSKLSKQCDQYELFPDYVAKGYNGFGNKKVPFANKIKNHISKENILDLEEKIKLLYRTIKKWNQKG